ncbi:ribonucleotide monophosphatase NagD (HAD superfamily) [Bradyrhizobium sp. JR3.5]
MTSLRFVERLGDLTDGVDVVLSDIWGVVHNGLESFPEACEALHTFRQQGGTVILITNAPRPARFRAAPAAQARRRRRDL